MNLTCPKMKVRAKKKKRFLLSLYMMVELEQINVSLKVPVNWDIWILLKEILSVSKDHKFVTNSTIGTIKSWRSKESKSIIQTMWYPNTAINLRIG